MKLRHLITTGVLGLTLAATEAFPQPPSGGRGNDRGGGGAAPGGFGGMPGGFGGAGGGGRSMRMMGDPNQMFDMIAQGKTVLNRADINPMMQGWFDRIAGQLGITNGQITRDQF